VYRLQEALLLSMDDKENWFIRELTIPTNSRLISIHVLTSTTTPMMRHNYQKHARKNQSYFLILKRDHGVSVDAHTLERRSVVRKQSKRKSGDTIP
jgi:hypothetical protein